MVPAVLFALQQQPPAGPDFSELVNNLARLAFFLFLFVFPLLGVLLRKLREMAEKGRERQASQRPPSPHGRSDAEVEGKDLWRELLEGPPERREDPGPVVVADAESREAAEREELERAMQEAERARRRQAAREAAARRAAERREAVGSEVRSAPPAPPPVGGLSADLGRPQPPPPAFGAPLGDFAERQSGLERIDEDRLESGWRPPATPLVEIGDLETRRVAAFDLPVRAEWARAAIAGAGPTAWRDGVLFAELLGPPVGLRPPDHGLLPPGLRSL